MWNPPSPCPWSWPGSGKGTAASPAHGASGERPGLLPSIPRSILPSSSQVCTPRAVLGRAAAPLPRRSGARWSWHRSGPPQKSGMNAYGLDPGAGQKWRQRTRRHQRWTTRHPIRFQECADRRPLLQQSCPYLRFPFPPGITPRAAPGAPGLSEAALMDAQAPGAAFCSSDPQPIHSDSRDQELLTLD